MEPPGTISTEARAEGARPASGRVRVPSLAPLARAGLALLLGVAGACHAPRPGPASGVVPDVASSAASDVASDAAPRQDPSVPAPIPGPDPGGPRDPERHAGTWLRGRPEDPWGLRMRFPVAVGWTDFRVDAAPFLDQLATVSVVPVLEAPVALDARWTVTPYVGLGGAYQNGDQLLVDGERWLGLARVGTRLHRWQAFAERYSWMVQLEARYDAALSSRNGLLGDWGSVDAGVELRAVLGELGEAPRLEPGVFVQGVHYWQAVELELEGVSPEFVDDQVEFGVSLGTHRPVRVLGVVLPRVRLGYLVGSELRGWRLRFGGL